MPSTRLRAPALIRAAAGDALHLSQLSFPASPASMTTHFFLAVVTRDLSLLILRRSSSSLGARPVLSCSGALCAAPSPARSLLSQAPLPFRAQPPFPIRTFPPLLSSRLSHLRTHANPPLPAPPVPPPKIPRRALPAIRTEGEPDTSSLISSSSSDGTQTRMSPLPPHTSPSPCEMREGGDGGDGVETKPALAPCPLHHPRRPRGGACRLRRPSWWRRLSPAPAVVVASLRTHDAHGHPQHACAHTYTKDAQDIEHDAALPHSLRRRWLLGRAAGARSRTYTGVRAPGP
ncbi:hypothetical protein DFH09DRAFT_1375094 [Mycena vulgaris]|nr:hypothetical protein DFH09DRAFT_1375094 [Mycena vulgaris]